MNDAASISYAIMSGYWNNFLISIYPRAKTDKPKEEDFEIPVLPASPAGETEGSRRHNPGEREIQHGIDLIRKILEEKKQTQESFPFCNA